MQLEAVLSRGFDGVVADLAQRAVAQPPRTPADAEQSWSKPEVTGRLDTLRMLLRRADGCAHLASVPALGMQASSASSQAVAACNGSRDMLSNIAFRSARHLLASGTLALHGCHQPALLLPVCHSQVSSRCWVALVSRLGLQGLMSRARSRPDTFRSQTCRAWEQLLEEVQKCLPLRVFAAAVISMHELGASLEAMQSAWLAYLRSPAADS